MNFQLRHQYPGGTKPSWVDLVDYPARLSKVTRPEGHNDPSAATCDDCDDFTMWGGPDAPLCTGPPHELLTPVAQEAQSPPGLNYEVPYKGAYDVGVQMHLCALPPT